MSAAFKQQSRRQRQVWQDAGFLGDAGKLDFFGVLAVWSACLESLHQLCEEMPLTWFGTMTSHQKSITNSKTTCGVRGMNFVLSDYMKGRHKLETISYGSLAGLTQND